MTKIITIGLGLAIAFAEAGKLKEATFRMALMAAEAQRHEMISLGKLSRMLESGGVEAQKVHNNHKGRQLLSH